MAEDDTLPANAVIVSVMHMVDPSTLWVTESPQKDMSKDREELIHLEEMLSGHCRRSSYNFQGMNYLPEEGELVAVQNPETGHWHRAQVDYVLHVTNGYIYKVFLVDHGLPFEVRSSAIRKLPAAWNNFDFQAFQVVLYGIIPTTVGMDYQDMKMKREVASNWSAAAVKFVKRLLEESTKSWLVYKKNVKKKIYGDLFLELSNGSISLSKELCSQEYAVFSEALFEEALIKSDTKQEEFVYRTPSPQVPVCTDSRNQNTSPVPSLSNKIEHRQIRDYIRECSVKRAKIEEQKCNQTDKWRRDVEAASVDTHEDGECFQSYGKQPLGRGMSILSRKEISPGVRSKLTPASVEQVGKWNEVSSSEISHEHEIKSSSLLGLLDLIDFNSDHDSISVSELNNASHKSLFSHEKNSSFTEYIPAGGDLETFNKRSKNQRDFNSSSVINRGRCSIDVENNSHSPSFKDPKKYDSVPDMLPQSISLHTERNEVQSSVVIHSEYGEEIGVKKQQRSLSLLKCVQTETNSAIKNSDNKTENVGGIQCDIKQKDITSVSTTSFFQDIVNSMERTAQSKRQNLLDNLKKNAQSVSSIPDVTAKLPQAALTAVLKRETSGNDTQIKSNSLASVETLPSVQIETLSTAYKFTDRLQTSRILVHGDMCFRTIQSIAEANFPMEIHQALAKMDFKAPMRIQTYVWPAIMRGQYTVLVGPPRSGKTVAYLIPLVSFMLTPDVYSDLPPGNGPLVLVLCSGSRSAQFVYEKCCTLLELSNQNKVRVEIAYGGDRERDLEVFLANGCDILISTPRCFMRLLRCSRFITNMERLAHLVLDGVDILAEKFLPELKELIAECKKMLERRSKVEMPVQVIATSEKWCPAVEQFSQHISQNFLVCISGYLEAAVYAKLKPTLHFLSASSRPQVVLDILDGYQGLYKTVIVCQSVAEVSDLVPVLESQCYQVLAAHEDMTQCHNSEICYHWKCSVSGVHPVLVCTDEVLHELDVCDAMWLIHYSLPHTKTGFGFRFSCLMDNYNSVFKKSTSKNDSSGCKVHIFADKDQTTRALPEVLHFLKRLSVPIAPDIEAKALEIVRQKESQKCSFPLCYYVKAFGECKERMCRSRHIILDAVDRPSSIPTCGHVKVKILHVHNASSFSARLLEHTDVHGCTVPIPDEYLAVNMAVYMHYSNESNRQLHGVPKLGDVCALESKINFFQRVQVVEVVKEDSKHFPEVLKVKFVDEGTFSVVKVYQLLAMPADLQRLPPQVIDIFLCNVLPCDLDTDWSKTANCRMKDWINDTNSGEEDGKFIVGKVMLSAGHTLWLDPLECRSYLSRLDTHVLELSLGKKLVKCGLAVKNPSHLNKLYELCLAGGLSVPSYEKVPASKNVQTKIQTLPSPQWAQPDTEIFEEISIIHAHNPHQLFIQRCKFSDSLERLIDELQKCVKTKPEDFHLEKGTYCLGKFPDDGLWYRARVDQLLEGDRALLFFVDHGDNASVSIDDIAPITEMLIKQLPFQAIECSLAGVKPLDEDTWSDEATDMLYEFNNNSSCLFCKVCDVMKTAVCTGGGKYKVVLMDTSTEVDIYLNRVLLERNLALPDNIEQIFENLDLVRSKQADSSEESGVEIEKSQLIDLSGISISQHSKTNAIIPSGEESILDTNYDDDDDDEYDNMYDNDDIQKLLIEILGLNTNCEPSMTALPALPSSHDHSTDNAAYSSSNYFSSDDDNDTDCMFPLVRSTRTPQVLWHQNDSTIYVTIMITGVLKYHIKWNVTHLQFSTNVNGQVYEVTLDLYGPVNASSMTHIAKGFFVHIKMMKTVIGFDWPRLLSSHYKQPWLKLDLEKYINDSDSEDVTAKSVCSKALKQLLLPNKEVQIADTGLIARANVAHIPVSNFDVDDDDDADVDDDDDSDVMETSYPYDSLN